MTLRVQPAWAVHLQPGSEIPLQDEAARRYLRRGSLPEALLRDAGRPALVAGEMALSHDELRSAAGESARRLKEIGVTQETHVALFAENSGAWIVAYLGLQLLGATVVGMNPAFKAAEAEQILSDSEAAVALVDAGRQSLIDALRPRLKALHQTARVEEIGSVPSPAASPSPSPLAGEGRGGGRRLPRSSSTRPAPLDARRGPCPTTATCSPRAAAWSRPGAGQLKTASSSPCRCSMSMGWRSRCMAR